MGVGWWKDSHLSGVSAPPLSCVGIVLGFGRHGRRCIDGRCIDSFLSQNHKAAEKPVLLQCLDYQEIFT